MSDRSAGRGCVEPAALERQGNQARLLANHYREPLLSIEYWRLFLRFFLDAALAAPVWGEDAMLAILASLADPRLRLFDPDLLAELRSLSRDPRLGVSGTAARFRAAIDETTLSTWTAENEDTRRLTATTLLVLRAKPFLGQPLAVGIPCRLRVTAFQGTAPPGSVTWANSLRERDAIGGVGATAVPAALAALGLARARLGYWVEIDDHRAALMGSSAGLPIAVCVGAFEGAEALRRRTVPRPGVAFLGEVTPNGGVLGVADQTLPAKLRAAVGAGLTDVVLPAENLSLAEIELGRIAARHPGLRIPRLCAVSHVSQVLSDDRITQPAAPSVRKRVRRPPSRRLAYIAPVALLSTALVAYLLLAPQHEVEVLVDPKAATTVVTRTSGPFRRDVSWNFGSPVTTARLTRLRPGSERALLVATSETGTQPAHLLCLDYATKDTVWSRDYSHRIPFGADFYAKCGFRIHEMTVLDFDDDGNQDVIFTVNGVPFSPSLVVWLDSNGIERGLYPHRGLLFHLTAADLSGDGRPEVYLCGTSNSDELPYLHRGTLVALDADHFAAWPEGGAFVSLDGDSRPPAPFDSSLARVIFPPIAEHCRISGGEGYTTTLISIVPPPGEPAIRVRAYVAADATGFVITLNATFEVVDIAPNDRLFTLVAEAMEAGELARDFLSPEGLDAYRQRIERVR